MDGPARRDRPVARVPGTVGAGRVLHETSLKMVQLVENVDWQEHRVVVTPAADWFLPD